MGGEGPREELGLMDVLATLRNRENIAGRTLFKALGA